MSDPPEAEFPKGFNEAKGAEYEHVDKKWKICISRWQCI
jgi:hypothetical protein